MGERLAALVMAANRTAAGLGKVAGAKPDETPLHSDAKTFRGIAQMLTGLAAEATANAETAAKLRRILQRIAMLEVRGAAELVECGDWKGIVGEVQAMAHDVLGGTEARAPRRARIRPHGAEK